MTRRTFLRIAGVFGLVAVAPEEEEYITSPAMRQEWVEVKYSTPQTSIRVETPDGRLYDLHKFYHL